MNVPYNFSSFDVSKVTEDLRNADQHGINLLTNAGSKNSSALADNPVLDPHMWATLGKLGIFLIIK